MKSKNHFKIIIPVYNSESWIRLCINSVKKQSYQDFQCIIIDDISTDNTAKIVAETILKDSRFTLIKNEEKKYALKNIFDGINFSNPSDEDVIVTLDGDDWLASIKTLEIVNNYYQNLDCWMTYGSYLEYPSNKVGKFAKQIPEDIIKLNLFRKYEWCSSHLRTFKYKLWKLIKKQDLLDNDGNFYKMAWDLSFMLPMLEMSGQKSQYIKEILYIYNLSNPNNDHKIDNQYQIKLESEIRNKNIYNLIDNKEEKKMKIEDAKFQQQNSYNRWINDAGEYKHRLNYNLNKNSVVLDWGGYDGEWSNLINNKFNCNIHIYEPFKEFVTKIKEKFNTNNKICIYDYGISDITKKVKMIEDDLATRPEDDENGEFLLVSCDEILNNFKEIDLLKINIEGSEYEIIERMIKTGDIKKIKNIQVQFHLLDNESANRYLKLKNLLEDTHQLTYYYPFIWENWEIK